MLFGGPLVLALGQWLARPTVNTDGALVSPGSVLLADVSVVVGLALFVLGAIVLFTAKKQCADCGYILPQSLCNLFRRQA